MGTPGPQKINRYGIAFKLKAVQMSNQPGVLIKDVAESLCIHPFMLLRWGKEVRDASWWVSRRRSMAHRWLSCSACGRWSSSSSASLDGGFVSVNEDLVGIIFW